MYNHISKKNSIKKVCTNISMIFTSKHIGFGYRLWTHFLISIDIVYHLLFCNSVYCSLNVNYLMQIHMKTMPTSIFRLLTGQETPHYIQYHDSTIICVYMSWLLFCTTLLVIITPCLCLCPSPHSPTWPLCCGVAKYYTLYTGPGGEIRGRTGRDMFSIYFELLESSHFIFRFC